MEIATMAATAARSADGKHAGLSSRPSSRPSSSATNVPPPNTGTTLEGTRTEVHGRHTSSVDRARCSSLWLIIASSLEARLRAPCARFLVLAHPMGSDAIQEWQRGVVAIGMRNPNLPSSALVGTGFIVDLQSGLIVTCAHVVLGAYKDHLQSPATRLDPGIEGVAIGVGIGEEVTWVCRAELRYISRPPEGYPGPDPPNHWVVKDHGARLDLAVLQLVALDGSTLQTAPEEILARGGRNARALCLGVPPATPRSVRLSDGAELVMLGYGQSSSGKGAEQTSTTMRGCYAGCYSSNGQAPGSLQSGDWLKVDVRILSGHSGGPVVNRVGEVIGWAVMSNAPLGQLRPIDSLVPALTSVLQQPCCNSPAGVPRDVAGGLRLALQGAIAPGDFQLGNEELQRCYAAARRAEQSAQDAHQSAQDAHLHEQGAYAHALFAARNRDDAAGQAEAAGGAAQRAEGGAGQAAAALSIMQTQLQVQAQLQAANAHVDAEAARVKKGLLAQTTRALAVPAPQHSQLAISQRMQQILDMGSHRLSTSLNPASFSSWPAGITQVQAGIDHGNPSVCSMVHWAQPQPQTEVLVMVYIDEDVPAFDETTFCVRLAKKLNAKDRLAEITRDQIRVKRTARAGTSRSNWKASLQLGQCYVNVKVDEDRLFMPSYSSSSDASSGFDGSSSDMESEEEQAETEVKEALRWVFGSSFFPSENVKPDLCYGPIQANSLWLAVRLPAPLALLLLEAARQRSPVLLDERVRCVRLIRNEALRDQEEFTAQLDDRPDIEECLATLEREEATVLAKVKQEAESSSTLKQVASDDDFDPEVRRVLFAADHYGALGIKRGATSQQVRAAYMKKTLLVHPDRLLMSEEKLREQLQREEEKLIEALQPKKRWPEEYTDKELMKQAETRGIKRKVVNRRVHEPSTLSF